MNIFTARFLRNMRVWKKITMIMILMGIPLAIAIYGFVSKALEDVNFNQKERLGAAYLVATSPLLSQLPLHRDAAQEARFNVEEASAKLAQLTAEVDATFQAAAAKDAELGAALGSTERMRKLQAGWNQLKASSDVDSEKYNALMDELIALIKHVGDTSNLTLDPELDTYYLMILAVSDFPEAVEDLSRLRTRVSEFALLRQITPEQRSELVKRLGSYEWASRAIDRDMKLAMDNNGSFAAAIKPALDKSAQAEGALMSFLQGSVIGSEVIDFLPEQSSVLFTAAINSRLQTLQASTTELDRLLAIRVNKLKNDTYLTLGLIIPGILLVFFVCFYISRSITRPLSNVLEVSKSIAHGDLAVQIPDRSDDEVGQLIGSMTEMTQYLREMAAIAETIAGGNLKVEVNPRSERDSFGIAFRSMCSSTQLLGQSREERDRIQQEIMKLLEEISGVGNGDLTVEAEVTAGATGAIADSFNFMIDELRKIIRNVKGSTEKVKGSATEIQSTTERLANGTVVQARQIADTSSAVEEMAASIQQVSDNATLSATVADQSRANAKTGAQAVQNSISGMQRIREQVQETAKRIKRLGERSQEIGEIIQLIDDIADRTSMLALNASIQAAMAGEAGRGFAVVAEEVERLAERSTNSTKQIAALIKSIQSETNDAVTAMEETTREVVAGSGLATEAGQALSEIEAVSNKLADLIQTISHAAQQQARGSEAITHSMKRILDVTKEIESGTSEATVTVGALVGLADSLDGSVSAFKLPGQTNGNGFSRN